MNWFLVEIGFLSFSTIGEWILRFRVLLILPCMLPAMNYSLGCIKISSTLGLFCGEGSIIIFINYSNYSDLSALGENFIKSPCLSFCHIIPFYGRFIPDASSRRLAPREKISAFVEIFSVIGMLFLRSSGAM